MTIPADVLAALATGAEAADRGGDWPAGSWAALRAAGVLGWAVPREYGGAGLGAVDLLRAGEALAAACPTTAFVLSQRDAAVRRLLAGPDRLKERYLPRLAAGETFLTVGLSQLTTSRQHGGPALLATPAAVPCASAVRPFRVGASFRPAAPPAASPAPPGPGRIL